MIELILKGDPLSEHSLYKTTCRGNRPRLYMTAKGKARKEDYQWQTKKQYRGEILKGQIELVIDIYFGNRRRHDWDRYHTLSVDALMGLVVEDDSQFHPVTVDLHYDKRDPRIELKLNPLGLDKNEKE